MDNYLIEELISYFVAKKIEEVIVSEKRSKPSGKAEKLLLLD